MIKWKANAIRAWKNITWHQLTSGLNFLALVAGRENIPAPISSPHPQFFPFPIREGNGVTEEGIISQLSPIDAQSLGLKPAGHRFPRQIQSPHPQSRGSLKLWSWGPRVPCWSLQMLWGLASKADPSNAELLAGQSPPACHFASTQPSLPIWLDTVIWSIICWSQWETVHWL